MTTSARPEIVAPLRAMGLFRDTDVTADPTPTMASPSWWGADSECFDVRRVDQSGPPQTAFVKSMIAHAQAYVDVGQAFAARRSWPLMPGPVFWSWRTCSTRGEPRR